MIIPAYNEAKNIVDTVSAVRNYAKRYSKCELDYIVINDGSTDNTKEVCEKNNIKCIHLIQNLGIGRAVQTGYIYATRMDYDIAVQFDGDGQHDIDSLEDLLQPILDKEVDFVGGSRFIDKSSEFQSTGLRRIGINFFASLISMIIGVKITDPTSGFRASNKEVIRLFAQSYPVDYPEPEALVDLHKNGFKIKEVQVNMFERTEGVSSINMYKSIYYMIKVTIAILCASLQKKWYRRDVECQ